MFDVENPVVRDELWNDRYNTDGDEYEDDYDDAEFWFHGRKYRQEPDWDAMPGGHDYYDDY